MISTRDTADLRPDRSPPQRFPTGKQRPAYADVSAARRLELVTEHSTDVLCEIREGVVTYVSPNSARVSGLDPDAHMGRAFRDLVHPDDLPALARYTVPGWTGPIEAVIRLADASGAWHWREARGLRVRDEDGTYHSVLILRDISDRHRAEEALKLSEARAHALLTAIPDLMFRLTREGVYLDFKAERHEDLYVPAETIIGSNMRDVLPPEVSAPAFAAIDRALADGGVETIEYTLVKKGEVRAYEARMTACADNEVVVLCRDVTEQKRAEQALRESERKHRALVEHALDVVYSLDVQGNVTEINAAGSALYGYSHDELIGMNIARVIDPEYLAETFSNMQWMARGEGLVGPRELLTYAKDGSPRWVEVHARPIFSDGTFAGFESIARDIGERKKAEFAQQAAEDALRDSERKYRTLIENARDVVYTYDLTGKLTSVNAMASHVYGYTREELLQMNFAQVVDPAYLPVAIDNMQRALRGEPMIAPLEFLTYAKDGSPRWVEVVAGPIMIEGEVTGFQGILREIGERKEAEEQIRLQAQLLDLVGQAILVTDVRGKITYWNGFAEALFGYTPGEACGLIAMALIDVPSRQEALAGWERVLAGEHWSGELSVLRKDGSSFPALVLGAPIRDAEGRVTGTIGVSSDISELKRIERQVRAASEQAAVLTERARIAHELHDTVAQFFFGIGMAAKDLADRKTVPPSMRRTRLAHILRLSTEGGREVRHAVQALSSAPPEGLDAAIERLVSDLRETTGQAVDYTREGAPVSLTAADQADLQRAVREALYNVRKHAKSSRVTVRLWVNDVGIVLTVSDNGRGEVAAIERALTGPDRFGLRQLRRRFEERGGGMEVEAAPGGGIAIRFALPRGEEA